MTEPNAPDPESLRLAEDRVRKKNWKRWGPYLSERQWGTVREDYSPDGSAWDYFPHDMARSRAYRWGEDGIAGISDRHASLCFALALWNGEDPYPERAPLRPHRRRGKPRRGREGVLLLSRLHADALVHADALQVSAGGVPVREAARGERAGAGGGSWSTSSSTPASSTRTATSTSSSTYAKASPEDILVRDRGRQPRPRGRADSTSSRRSGSATRGRGASTRESRARARAEGPAGAAAVAIAHPAYGDRTLYAEGAPELLFTENETNNRRLFGTENDGPYVKDAFHERVVHGVTEAVNPAGFGTKAAAWYRLDVPAGGSKKIRLRLTDAKPADPVRAPASTRFSPRAARRRTPSTRT